MIVLIMFGISNVNAENPIFMDDGTPKYRRHQIIDCLAQHTQSEDITDML